MTRTASRRNLSSQPFAGALRSCKTLIALRSLRRCCWHAAIRLRAVEVAEEALCKFQRTGPESRTECFVERRALLKILEQSPKAFLAVGFEVREEHHALAVEHSHTQLPMIGIFSAGV